MTLIEQGTTIQILNAKRDKMRSACAGIGEPAVELPIDELKAYKDDSGKWHAIIGMNQLIYLIDDLLRQS